MADKKNISLLSRPWIGLAARIIVGGVLVAAGLSKASAPSEEFAVVIESYQIVSASTASTLAALLPWLEVLIGFCLIGGYFTGASAIAAGAMAASFLGALISTKVHGIILPNCGCFGAGFHASITEAISMDSILLILAYFANRSGADLFSLDRWTRSKIL